MQPCPTPQSEQTKAPEGAVEPFDQQHFLDLFERILPQSYLDPLKNPGPGYEYLKGVAAAAARISESVAHEATGQYIWAAPTGAYATGTVNFKRPTTLYGQIVVKAYTTVATPDGYRFRTTQDVTFSPSAYAVTNVPVVALAKGYLWNVPAPFTSLGNQEVRQGISVITRPLFEDGSGNPAFDPTITVEQATDTTGGVDPYLNQLGSDRGIPITNEPIDIYRYRLASLPDVVSPCAIWRGAWNYLTNALKPYGQQNNFSIIESWEFPYQTAYDFPINETFADGPYFQGQTWSGNVFVYDDPRPIWMSNPSDYALPYQVTNRYVDGNDVTGAIIVAVPLLPSAASPDYALIASVYSGLGQLLERIKPAGITIEIILQGQ